MRKHLLWYLKGWPRAKKVRNEVVVAHELDLIKKLVVEYASELRSEGVVERMVGDFSSKEGERFLWDPKFDMDRKLDRGGSDEDLD
jgi:hypothetical protein